MVHSLGYTLGDRPIYFQLTPLHHTHSLGMSLLLSSLPCVLFCCGVLAWNRFSRGSLLGVRMRLCCRLSAAGTFPAKARLCCALSPMPFVPITNSVFSCLSLVWRSRSSQACVGECPLVQLGNCLVDPFHVPLIAFMLCFMPDPMRRTGTFLRRTTPSFGTW